MGQYYKLAIMTADGEIRRNDRKYVDSDYVMAKLMEHGYLHNWLCYSVAKGLENGSIKRLAWVGDYAEEDEMREITKGDVSYAMIWGDESVGEDKDYGRAPEIIFPSVKRFSYKGKYLLNHTKKVYMSFDEYTAAHNAHNAHENAEKGWEISPFTILNAIGNGYNTAAHNAHENAEKGWEISPFTILTAIGNGRGGGDYGGDCQEAVGTWAWDEIGIAKKIPDGYTKVLYPFHEDR